MFSTLRQRLIWSHLLPLLVIIPVMGIALIYVLETEVLVPSLAQELAGETRLIARLAAERPGLWNDPMEAQLFVDNISQDRMARIMLLDNNGRLLASNNPAGSMRLERGIDPAPLADVLNGETVVRTTYSRNLHAEIADVWFPVVNPEQKIIGAVRLSHQLLTVQEQFLRLRYLIMGVLISGLVLGTGVGLLLALNIERPVRQVTQAIHNLATGQQKGLLNEQGPQETRLLLRAVNSLVERLHSLEQARRQLLANVVHELGRPLGALLSAIQALKGGADRDETLRRELLVGMEDEVGRLQHVLDDLAGLHDQVLGTLELDRRPINLNQWLPRVLAPWREAAQDKGLSWQTSIPDCLPPLEADTDRLAQVIGNLVSNAIKYTPQPGIVSIEVGQKDEAIRIQVSDTGPGIDVAEQAKIFDPLYRGHSLRRFPQGLGLGLTIARDLVTAHGGHLDVHSEPGQGSQFILRLPLQPATKAPN
jgi:signal transduction histidine kinase